MIKKNGVDDAITITVNITWKILLFRDRNDSGIPRSVASMSFENRFMIRPDGVDSKNSIVLRNIENSIELCNVLVAPQTMYKNNKSDKKVNIPYKNNKL